MPANHRCLLACPLCFADHILSRSVDVKPAILSAFTWLVEVKIIMPGFPIQVWSWGKYPGVEGLRALSIGRTYNTIRISVSTPRAKRKSGIGAIGSFCLSYTVVSLWLRNYLISIECCNLNTGEHESEHEPPVWQKFSSEFGKLCRISSRVPKPIENVIILGCFFFVCLPVSQSSTIENHSKQQTSCFCDILKATNNRHELLIYSVK